MQCSNTGIDACRFVNGSGILLALFSTVLFASNTLIILFIIGGLTSYAQFTKLLQVNVKQKLACSTIAQMGFIDYAVWFGVFNAARSFATSWVLQAYLFLSAGGNGAFKTQKSQLKSNRYKL
jgi:NAD(P)H-quinone oxidoreductase subunit 5